MPPSLPGGAVVQWFSTFLSLHVAATPQLRFCDPSSSHNPKIEEPESTLRIWLHPSLKLLQERETRLIVIKGIIVQNVIYGLSQSC